MRQISIYLFCAVILAACGSGGNYAEMVQMSTSPKLVSSQDEAILVMIGRKGVYSVFRVYLDRDLIGILKRGSYFVTSIIPGEHYIITKRGFPFSIDDEFAVGTINFEAGKTYVVGQDAFHNYMYVEGAIPIPILNPVPVLYLIPSDEAKVEMRDRHHMRYVPDQWSLSISEDLYEKATDGGKGYIK